jgi:hypothetical protein
MSVKKLHTNHYTFYFVTFTCYRWINIFDITSIYDFVYEWFDIFDVPAVSPRFIGGHSGNAEIVFD